MDLFLSFASWNSYAPPEWVYSPANALKRLAPLRHNCRFDHSPPTHPGTLVHPTITSTIEDSCLIKNRMSPENTPFIPEGEEYSPYIEPDLLGFAKILLMDLGLTNKTINDKKNHY